MSKKNNKIYRAAMLGRKIDFWNWVEDLALKMEDIALRKMNNYISEQNKIMSDIVNEKTD